MPELACLRKTLCLKATVLLSVLEHKLVFLSIKHLPKLASLAPYVPQSHTGKVDDMKPPHQLSREAIDEFKVIYQEEFGEILSDDEVQEIAMRLLRFFGILEKGK